MSVDQITREHHQRIANTAEAYFAAVQRGERGTPLEWHQKEFSTALLNARNAIGTSKTALEGAMERAIKAGDPDLFRRHLPGAQAIAALEETAAHAVPAAATPVAHAEEPLGLSPQMEHYVEHQPSLAPGARADELAHQAMAEMPAADLAALKAKPSLLPLAASAEAIPAKPVRGFTHKIRGLALGGALASTSLPAVAADTHGETWRGAPLEPVAHRAQVDGVRTASVLLPDSITMTRRAPTPPRAQPLGGIDALVGVAKQPMELPEPAAILAEAPAPQGRILSETPFGPPAPLAEAAAPAHASLPAVSEAAPSRGQRMKQALGKLWPFGKKVGDAHDVPFISNAHPTPASNGGIILPEIGKTAEIATESKGRPALIVAGTLAAVGGAAFLASGGQHQQREYQRRLDAASLAQDQGIA